MLDVCEESSDLMVVFRSVCKNFVEMLNKVMKVLSSAVVLFEVFIFWLQYV
jgi:hypothetical protein